jgi:Ca2+-binding RTX toxin-like protein
MVTRIGTDGPDLFDDGTEDDDLFRGLAGNDVLLATDGNDTLDGGTGRDIAAYQWWAYPDGVFINNSDAARGGVAPFTADKRGYGVDKFIGIEDLNGSIGPDVVHFWYSGAIIQTWMGDDLIVAPPGTAQSPNNILAPGPGQDTIWGSDSGDLLLYRHAETSVEPPPTRGALVDLAAGTATDPWGDQDEFSGIRGVEGSNRDDRLLGSSVSDTILGNWGDDRLAGRDGGDYLSGGNGTDTLDGGDGNDWAFFLEGNHGILAYLDEGWARDAWLSQDTLISIENVEGTDLDDFIRGSEVPNFLSGGRGDDYLHGSGIGDEFEPGPGKDEITGGSGIGDAYTDDEAANVLWYSDEDGAIDVFYDGPGRVREDWRRTPTGEEWSTTDTFYMIDLVIGTDFADRFRGAAGRDWFIGGRGNDTFRGGDGADIVEFFVSEPNGVVVDLSAGTGTDGYGDTDTFFTIEEIRGTGHGDRILGDDLRNTLRGADGNDTLIGGGAADSLDGGAGVDTAVWARSAGQYILTLGSLAVMEKGADGVTDTLEDVELLRFSDGFSFGAKGAIDFRLIEGVRTVSAEDLTTFVEMYIAYFDRAPDSLGLFYWGTRLAQGMGLEEIAASFFVQPESQAIYPDPDDNAALVDAVYRNLLERDPDAGGRSYWIDALERGDVSRPEFMLAIINGAKAATGDPADAKVVEDKGRIGLDYAVINGLNDVGNAEMAMAAYDRDDGQASLAQAEVLIDGFRSAAEAGDAIVVELAGVIDDPFGDPAW